MGALEGAAITVLSKGVTSTERIRSTPHSSPASRPAPRCFTAKRAGLSTSNATVNPFPSSFQCNPSSIDGLGITNSSQGGGGIFVHGWGHNIQIANNRISTTPGTLSGGINVGQGEFPPSLHSGVCHERTSGFLPDQCYDECPTAVLPQPEREHTQQRHLVELVHRRRTVLGHALQGLALSASAPAPTSTNSTTTGFAEI